jgi:hypothetical protein
MIVRPVGITTLILFLQQVAKPAEHAVNASALGLVVAAPGVVPDFFAASGRGRSATLRVIMQRPMGMVPRASAIHLIADDAKALLPGPGPA